MQNRHIGLKVAAGVVDFFGAAICALLILGLLMLLINLFGWLQSDLATTFDGITQNVLDAVIIPPN